jgi:hypothetical protein
MARQDEQTPDLVQRQGGAMDGALRSFSEGGQTGWHAGMVETPDLIPPR